MNKLALGCSHTYGVGVEQSEAWPSLLDCINLGKSGVSADYIKRNIPHFIKTYVPNKIYVLWPEWRRFEYIEDVVWRQSLPTDKNRIKFIEEWTDEKLQENFMNSVNFVKDICRTNNIKLVHLTLYDLVPYIDAADRWPLSKLGHHYSPLWHTWVADIFRKYDTKNLEPKLSYD